VRDYSRQSVLSRKFSFFGRWRKSGEIFDC